MNSSDVIVKAWWEHLSLPLQKPYVLSFLILKDFDTLLLHLEFADGQRALGEIVSLPGYFTESLEDVIQTLNNWLPTFSGKSTEIVRGYAQERFHNSPLACSLVCSTIDSIAISARPCLNPVPLIYPTSSQEPKLRQVLYKAFATGYRTVKVKVGENLEQDLLALEQLHAIPLPSTLKFRFDANQAYSLEEAQVFLTRIENLLSEQTELVEQPLPAPDWDSMAILAHQTKLPLMLDESIYDKSDIAKAASIGCQLIKLKLCKHGGIQELVKLAQYAQEIGLQVIIGNGVATDISNLLELQVYNGYPKLFLGASESNGFAKLKCPIAHKTLTVTSGYAVW